MCKISGNYVYISVNYPILQSGNLEILISIYIRIVVLQTIYMYWADLAKYNGIPASEGVLSGLHHRQGQLCEG